MSAAGQAIGAAVVALVLWVACMGVGATILPRREHDRPDRSIPTWNQAGIAACIGLAVLLALGGFGIALHLPVWLLVGPFVVIGLTLSVVSLLGLKRQAIPLVALALTAAVIAAFVFVAMLESQFGLRAQLNRCDELRAYLPMVNRLLDTNAIIEPWSYRRVQNLGGFTFLEAIHVSLFGNEAIGVAETLLAGVFLGGLFVATGFRSTWTRIAALLFILSIPVMWVPRINVAPVLLMVPLVISAFAVTAELRRALGSGERGAVIRWSVSGGLLLAAIAAVRIPPLPVVGITLAAGALTVSAAAVKERLRAIAIAVAATLVALSPWLYASWESVGTPLYPLLAGNANRMVPSERDPTLHTLGDFASNTLGYLRSGSYFWVALGALVLALLARKLLPDARLVVIIAITTMLGILVFSVTLSIASNQDFGRYIAPLGESIAVFIFYEVLRALDASPARDPATRSPAIAALALGATVLALLAAFSPLGVRSSLLLPSGWNQFKWNSAPHPGFVRPDETAAPPLERQMRRALKLVDPKRTILAVDRPYVVDYSKFDLPSLDLPGWAAPDGTFPFFAGPLAKIVALQREGFTYLIMTNPSKDLCLVPNRLIYETTHQKPPVSTYAKYYLNWLGDMEFVARSVPGSYTEVGVYRVFDLKKARAAFHRAASASRQSGSQPTVTSSRPPA